MVFIVSSLNSCTYTLDPVNNAVLYHAPLLSDGSYETAFSAYAEVEWDKLDEENSNFSWHVALSDAVPEDKWKGHTGFIHNVLFEQYLKDHPAPEDCEY